MKKRVVTGILIATMLVTSLAGCGGSGSGKPSKSEGEK